jgi:trehalose-phosphatase
MDYLFKHWERMKKNLQGKGVFLFLDFDGTLAPIVGSPHKARISTKAKRLIQAISLKSNFKVAIISGRALADIKNKVGIEGLIYSGNHGLEVDGPQVKYAPLIPVKYKDTLKKIKSELESKLLGIKGALMEDKGISLALHYRQVNKDKINFVKTIFREVTIIPSVANKIKTRDGKKVLEVCLPTEWDKGKIVLWLLSRQKFMDHGRDVVPMYIGDDKTDEDAFEVLRKGGITVLVGRRKPSLAEFYIKGPQEVEEFLEKLLNA